MYQRLKRMTLAVLSALCRARHCLVEGGVEGVPEHRALETIGPAWSLIVSLLLSYTCGAHKIILSPDGGWTSVVSVLLLPCPYNSKAG